MTRDELVRIAMRYDTAVSRAMLRALGVEPPHRNGGKRRQGVILRVDRYDDMPSLMAQRHGVRDL